MSGTTEELAPTLLELQRLLVPGVLGFYTRFEVTEIVAFGEHDKQPFNVLTVLVCEDRENEPP